MKFKYLIILIIVFARFSSAMAQPNYRQAALDTTANYYQIVADFEAWIDTVQLPDSVKTREIKKFGRWASFWSQRVQCEDPLQNGLFSTYQNSLGMAWITPYCTTADDANWENFGPFPDALTDMGIISTIWFEKDNPDTILVGSGRTGGIFKSVNRGSTWYDVLSPTRIPAFGISSFAVSPVRNPITGKRVIYASTGSDKVGYSTGILKSEDGGETWAILDMFLPYLEANFEILAKKIIVSHVNGNDMLYVIAGNRVLWSSDGGLTWGESTIQGRTNYIFNDIEVCPGNHLIYAVSGFSPKVSGRAKVWITYNGGMTFTEILGNCGYGAINQVTRVLLSFPGSTTLYVCTDGSIDRKILNFNPSTNQWSTLPPNYPEGWGQFSMFEVNPAFDHFYIGTEFFHVNTSSLVGSPKNPYGIFPNTHNDIRCMDFLDRYFMLGTDGGVIYSDDFGDTWVSINGYGNSGLTNNEVMGMDLLGGFENEVVAGLYDNSFKHYRNNKWHSAIPTTNTYIQLSGPPITKQDYVGIGDVGNVSFNWQNSNEFLAVTNYGRVKASRIGSSYSAIFDWTQSNYHVGQWWSTPLTRSFADPDMVYTGGFQGKIYISSDGGNSFPGTGIQLPGTNADVLRIKLAPSNPQIVYALTAHTTGVANTTGQVLYRSDDSGLSWTDISGGSNLATSLRNQWCTASDFTIDWNNPDRVWVSFGGLSMNFGLPYTKERVFTTFDASQGAGTEWLDISGASASELPFLPATAIANQPGTSRVFLATDGGVFCKSDKDNKWKCFSNGLPITFIKSMMINKETNELFASTYGYGIWKASLCEPATQSYIIDQGTGDVTWSNTTFSAGDIVVKSGYKLTINENAQIFMDPNTSILVEKGAELVVDNATLTACEEMWQGIRVMGTYSLPQNTTNQGKVTLINGATIANARVGVETGKARAAGGIIQAENAYFYNCEYGVKMHPYKNFNPNDPTVLRPNLSLFTQCTFSTTGSLKKHFLYPMAFIWLNGIHHLQIEGCTFKNHQTIDIPNPLHLGYGIQAFASTFLVMPHCTSTSVPCTEYARNSFSNLYCGIHASDALTNASFYVNNADFTDNMRGIEVVGMDGFTVTSNEFFIPSSPVNSPIYPVGLQLDGCKSGFHIEDNEFTAEWKAEESMIWENAGLVVDNSGPLNNFVYNNRFSNTSVATIAQGQNKKYFDNTLGLQYCCNQFDHHLNALAITNVAMGEGIAANQGFYINVPGTITTQLSNNLFQDVQCGSTSEIHNDGTWLQYYYHFDQPYPPTEGTTTNPKPHVSSSNVFLHAVPDNWSSNNCPSTLGGSSVSSLKLANTSFKNKANACREVIEQLVDGGDTENMLWTIEDSEPGDAYDLMLALLEESPYLSEQVLVSVVQNEEVLTPAMVTQILTANPQASHSQEVWEALYNRTLPLPQYMLDAIEYNINVSSPKEVLENELAYYLAERQKAFDALNRFFLNNTDEQIDDELLEIYANDSSLHGEILLATECLKRGMVEEAIDRLDSVPLRIPLDSIEQSIYDQQKAMIELHMALLADSNYLDSITPESVEWLRGIAANSGNHTAMVAQALIGIIDTLPYHGPVYFPTTQPARFAKNPAPDPKINYLKLFPNPSREYFIIEYALDKPNFPGALVEIRTIDGRLVKTIEVKDPQNQIIINTNPFARGLYLCLLKQGTNTLAIQKIVIEK